MADWQYSGNNGKIDQGYYVKSPDISADWQGNAWLESPGGDILNLWIDDFSASFEMGGSFAQSKYRRSYFSRNFVQPHFTVHGQMPNSYQYQRLAEFVRESQLAMLNNSTLKATGLMALHLADAGEKGVSGSMRGHHQGYHMRGYVVKIGRGAERFVNAPTFQFDFTLAYSYQGLFKTSRAIVEDLATWTQVFKKHKSFTPDPDNTTTGSDGTTRPGTYDGPH